MAKRSAETDLNHENWDKEEEAEEPGLFQKANDDILQKRVIKTAKRRSTNTTSSLGSKASPFSGFSGFSTTAGSTTGSPFSFLDQIKNNVKDNTNVNDTSLKFDPVSCTSFQPKDINNTNFLASVSDKNSKITDNFKSSENDLNKNETEKADKKSQSLESLKELNLSCNSWITEHLQKNPYCILTPIFKDYEKHLAQLDLEAKVEKIENTFQLPKLMGKSPASEPSKRFQFSKTDNDKMPNEQEKNSDSKLGGEIDINKSEIGTFQFSGAQSSFQFPGIFKPTTEAVINLNVGGNLQKEGNDEDDEETSEPPKSDFVPVAEEDSIYDKRCKIFIKKDSNFVSKGVGTLFLKPVKGSKNTQLIVRADTSSGNILLNVLLTSTMPVQKKGKNNVMVVCLPTPESQPPPVPVLIRVKTSEDCDEVIKKLDECKGS